MIPRYLVGSTLVPEVGTMYENLLRGYGIFCVCEGSTLRFGYWDSVKIWLLDPRVLLDAEKVAILIDTLGSDAHVEDIEKAKQDALIWIEEHPQILWPSAFS